MNNLAELKLKIQKSSLINEVEILISLRAFLFNQEECPWFILDDLNSLNEILEEFKIKDAKYYKNRNIRNIKKINVDITYLYNMPKNKRLILINILNDAIENLLSDKYLIIDNIRVNPFFEDKLFEFLISNKTYIKLEDFNIYKKRNEDRINLLSLYEIKNKKFDTCLDIAIKTKIKNYWKKIWYDKISYDSSNRTMIENLIL